jgi:tetratricopeptide (TPR) repeat protein
VAIMFSATLVFMGRFLVLVLMCGALHGETVLVVPFFNHSKSGDVGWIGESISESLHDSLTSENVLVLDRADRLEAYRRLSLKPGAELTRATVIKIGESLDASRVVFGEYELLPSEPGNTQSKGSLRIAARILDLTRTSLGPTIGELGAVEDLTTLEAHLAWQVFEQLNPRAAPPERDFVAARPAVRLDAVESYVRGLLAATPEQRHHFFTQAARLDEHFSQPCFQLGKTYWEQKEYKIAAGWFTRVTRADSHYLEAQFFLGLCLYDQADFNGAGQAFQIVSASMPLNEVYNDLGASESRRGQFAEARASFEKAIEGDSGDPDYHFNRGYALWRAGQFEAAVESFRSALDRNPSDAEAMTLLGRALKREGPRPAESRVEGRERLKTNYEEGAYRQLQAELAK